MTVPLWRSSCVGGHGVSHVPSVVIIYPDNKHFSSESADGNSVFPLAVSWPHWNIKKPTGALGKWLQPRKWKGSQVGGHAYTPVGFCVVVWVHAARSWQRELPVTSLFPESQGSLAPDWTTRRGCSWKLSRGLHNVGETFKHYSQNLIYVDCLVLK